MEKNGKHKLLSEVENMSASDFRPTLPLKAKHCYLLVARTILLQEAPSVLALGLGAEYGK